MHQGWKIRLWKNITLARWNWKWRLRVTCHLPRYQLYPQSKLSWTSIPRLETVSLRSLSTIKINNFHKTNTKSKTSSIMILKSISKSISNKVRCPHKSTPFNLTLQTVLNRNPSSSEKSTNWAATLTLIKIRRKQLCPMVSLKFKPKSNQISNHLNWSKPKTSFTGLDHSTALSHTNSTLKTQLYRPSTTESLNLWQSWQYGRWLKRSLSIKPNTQLPNIQPWASDLPTLLSSILIAFQKNASASFLSTIHSKKRLRM